MTDVKRTPVPRRSRLLCVLGDELLLLCALMGALYSFSSLYQFSHVRSVIAVSYIPPDLPVLDLGAVTLAALLSGLAALVLWSLPRFRLPLLTAAAAGWCGAAWRLREQLAAGGQMVWRTVANLLFDRCGWGRHWEPLQGLSASEQTAALTALMSMAVILLALLLGWAVVRARRWWLVLALTLPPLLPGLLADVYPNWPAFLTLAAVWCTMLLTDLCRHAAPSGRGRLTLAVLPCVGALLALLSLAMPMKGYSRPQWTLRAQALLTDFGSRHLSFLSNWDGPFEGPTYVGAAETVDLAEAGPLRFTGRTVLKVSGDYSGRVYLRGTSLAHYGDSSWTALSDGEYQQYTQAVEELGDASARSPLLFSAATAPSPDAHTVTVKNTGASNSCVYAPYYLADQDWETAGAVPVGDSLLARRRGLGSVTLEFAPGLEPGGYLLDFELSRSERVYIPFVQEHYLDIPEELADYFGFHSAYSRERLLTQYLNGPGWQDNPDNSLLFSENEPLLLAEAVAYHLSVSCAYDPDTPAVPTGEDFVEYFLTESRRGYCMHFATAAALMLRHLGVPARYVSGFTAQLSAGETTNVPDSAAHAWVEIYLDGFGWYPVEVTPSYDGPDDAESQPPSAAPLPSAAPSLAPRPSDDPAPSQAPSAGLPGDEDTPLQPGGSSQALRRLLGALVWLLAAAGAAALLWLGQYLPKRMRAARLAGEDANRAVLYGYRCLTRLEKWGGTLPEQALALARKARFSQHTLTPRERQAMAGMVDRQRAWLRESLPPVKRLLFRYLWGWPPAGPKKEDSADDMP